MSRITRRMICHVCHNGCTITAEYEDGNIEKSSADARITGHHCVRGRDFALSQIQEPLQDIIAVIKSTEYTGEGIPVRLSSAIGEQYRDMIIQAINSMRVTGQVQPGQIIVKNLLGMGVDLIATDMDKEKI